MFKFSQRSENNLKGVHTDLVHVVRLALHLSEIDFMVTEGLRTKARQTELVRQGKSKTMNSRHLTGHAVDLCPYPVDYNDLTKFKKISESMFKAAEILNVPIEWGGNWKTFHDAPHFELARSVYP